MEGGKTKLACIVQDGKLADENFNSHCYRSLVLVVHCAMCMSLCQTTSKKGHEQHVSDTITDWAQPAHYPAL